MTDNVVNLSQWKAAREIEECQMFQELEQLQREIMERGVRKLLADLESGSE